MSDEGSISPETRLEPGSPESSAGDGGEGRSTPPRKTFIPLPGIAAISLYMLLLSGVDILGVATGHVPPIYLFFATAFIAAGLGLLLLLRWAWALTLAAVMLLAALFLWKFAMQYSPAFLIQGLLNFVFFLYLIRGEVRQKLK